MPIDPISSVGTRGLGYKRGRAERAGRLNPAACFTPYLLVGIFVWSWISHQDAAAAGPWSQLDGE